MSAIPIPIDPPMPANITAEHIVLVSLLGDDSQLAWVSRWLTVEDFYLRRNAEIYRAMLALHSRGERATIATVERELAASSEPTARATCDLLRDLIPLASPRTGLLDFVKIIREKSQLRQLACACDMLKDQCFEGVDPNLILDRMQLAAESFRGSWTPPKISNADQLQADTQAAMQRSEEGRYDA